MRIFVPKETVPGEKRASVVPETAKKLVALGAEVAVETDIGASIHRGDGEYETAGVHVIADRIAGLHEADAVLRLRKPPADEVPHLRENCVHISFLDPFNERELIEQLAAANVIGANDVVNPAAREEKSSPIYGMPIINVDQAHIVSVLKRSMASGFAGIENPLFFQDNTTMIFGDAKKTVQEIVSEFKAA